MRKINLNQTTKNTSKYIYLLVLSFLFLFSCSQKDNLPQGVQLQSPNGYVLAESIDELIAILDINPESKVLDINYLEKDQTVIGFVTYKDENGKTSTVAIAIGDFNYDANCVEVKTNSKSKGGTIKITCSGCEDCRVMGSINPDGIVTISCESSCCTMTVTLPSVET